MLIQHRAFQFCVRTELKLLSKGVYTFMQALVLENVLNLSLREFEVPAAMGPNDVRININTVGICGSDVHYYLHGAIGPYVVKDPMVLGHEASGVVTEIGGSVTDLKLGDRVCMEPGIPDSTSRASRNGQYNLDPNVQFWATPPVHGCLTPSVVHPARFCYKLPDNVSFAEGAMVEPLAVGMHAAAMAGITPGDVAVVMGAGPIGILTALAALAGGCSSVFISDVQKVKLEIAASYPNVHAVNVKTQDLATVVRNATAGWGADIVFEASGASAAIAGAIAPLCPGGTLVLIGMPLGPVAIDVVAAQAKEITIKTIFRYANVFDRAVALISSGKIDVKPLITHTFPFSQSIRAFEFASSGDPSMVKSQIIVGASAG